MLAILVGGLYQYGFFASAKYYIVIFPAITLFALSIRKAATISVFAVLIYVCFGIAYVFELLTYRFDVSEFAQRYWSWCVDGIVLALGLCVLFYVSKQFIHGYMQQITALHDKNVDLELSEKKHKLFFEGSNDAIFLLKDTGIFDFNRRSLALFSCDSSYLFHKQMWQLASTVQYDTILSVDLLQKKYSLLNRENCFFEMKFCRPDSTVFFSEVSLSRVTLYEKECVMAIIRNISERKEHEHDLEQYRTGLEEMVLVRTSELEKVNRELLLKNEQIEQQKCELEKILDNLQNMQEQLIESEKMASIGILTAGLAHEINNPLNFIKSGIYGLSQIIEKRDFENDDADVRVVLNRINMGVDKVADIIRSLNYFNHGVKENMQPCNAKKIIENCLMILNHEIKEKCKIQVDLHDDDLHIVGIPGKFHQIFLNLLMNSCQAIFDKGEISIWSEDGGDGFVNICVKDTGCGIPQNLYSKVFTPFFTTKDPGVGTGLGLSIVYKIVKEHGGRIRFVSSQESGTLFVLTLKCVIPEKIKKPLELV